MRIEGTFNDELFPQIEIDIEGAKDKIEVIVDTGFNGELMLPEEVIKELDLLWIMSEYYRVASGEIKVTEVYKGNLSWFSDKRAVEVMATQSDQGLLGMQLLTSCRLEMDVPAKTVFIETSS